MNHPRPPPAQTFAGIFVAGLIAALPLAATLLVVAWALRLLFGWIGPDSFIGRMLVALGLGGAGSEVVGYLVGVAIVLAAIFALGLVVQTRWRRWLGRGVDALMQRIPVVRSIYSIVGRFVGMLSPVESGGLQSMRPVWCHFGGPGGVAVLGLLSCAEPVYVGGAAYQVVLVPTAPVPVGGGLLYVPLDWVTPAELGIEALTSIYVSMGVTSPQHLPTARDGKAAPAA
ncbi:MAG: DUF502 domain-containing protein [Pseudomonadota bacterium]